MAYRFTDTNKWNDAWFLELKPSGKLLFNYLCDNCDVAGFIELNPRKWAFDIGETQANILGALEGLGRGLIYSTSNDCVYVKNFLKHQKNLPLNEKNNAHVGILKCFDKYKNKFEIDNIQDFINQEVKPLARGYGNGNGKGKGNGSIKECEIFNFENALKMLGLSSELVTTFLQIRKKKRLVNSEIAFNGLVREINKSGLTATEVITICIERSWGGFDSEWIKNNTNNGNKQQNGLDADAKWRAEMQASIARDYAALHE